MGFQWIFTEFDIKLLRQCEPNIFQTFGSHAVYPPHKTWKCGLVNRKLLGDLAGKRTVFKLHW